MRALYYRENESGDFLMVAWGPEHRLHNGLQEARATAIAGNPASVCTTCVSPEWLRKSCQRVAKSSVPAEWLGMF